MLFAAATPLLARPSAPAQLAMEAYIWQQYAARQGKNLGQVLDDVFPMAQSAGFTNVELNDGFFERSLRDRVLELVRSNKLRLPSVYVGGVMHEDGFAEETIKHAVEIARICAPFDCKAVVHNPNPKKGAVPKTDAESQHSNARA
jgi:sugar phosphate isomerase/epimerase